jgi:hypothetical protein
MHHALGALDELAATLLDEPVPWSAISDPVGAYMHVALNAVLEPKHLSAVPVSRLIKFRNGHTAELQAFREHIAGLSRELEGIANVENMEIAQAQLQSLYETRTAPELEKLRKALHGFGIDSVAGALALKVDLGAASTTALGAGALAAGGHPLLSVAAVALSVVPYLATRVRHFGELESASPVAYLLAADRTLHGRSLLHFRTD